jgi:hypothetical protein
LAFYPSIESGGQMGDIKFMEVEDILSLKDLFNGNFNDFEPEDVKKGTVSYL